MTKFVFVRRIATVFISLLLSLACLDTASASTMTWRKWTVEQTGDGGTFGGALRQFNPTLGTLQSVSVSFTGDVDYFVYYDPPAGCSELDACQGDAWFSTGYSFNAPGFPPTSYMEDSDMFEIVNYNFSLWSEGNYNSGGNGIYYSASTSDLSDYIGNGTVFIQGGISEDSDYCINWYYFFATCYQFDVLHLITELEYTYQPKARVPEPFTLPVFGAGLVSLIAIRGRYRRRNRAKVS